MGTVHHLQIDHSTSVGDERAAVRRRVLMRATARLPGRSEEWPVTVKDLSSTGMRAIGAVSMFPGTQIEIELPHIGWISGEVVRVEGENIIGIRFGAIINPEQTQVRVSGSYGAAPSQPVPLKRI